MDESRKAFESWCRVTRPCLTTIKNCDRKTYSHDKTQAAWKAWQASRAAIEIELPKKIEHQPFDTDFENGFCGGHNNAIDSAIIRIRAAGIKVKE